MFVISYFHIRRGELKKFLEKHNVYLDLIVFVLAVLLWIVLFALSDYSSPGFESGKSLSMSMALVSGIIIFTQISLTKKQRLDSDFREGYLMAIIALSMLTASLIYVTDVKFVLIFYPITLLATLYALLWFNCIWKQLQLQNESGCKCSHIDS